MKRGRIIGYGLLITILALIAAGLYYRYDIQDWLRLRGYQPAAEIVQIADRTTMQDSSRRVFYANRPVIADRELFNEHCRDNEHSIVLGCYLPGQRGIYILDVTDERLSGIEEVTAAHELLHAVYERLSSKERQRIDDLTQNVFDNLDNTRVRSTIESYRKQDPKIVPNELHSVLGTEIRSLPKELEDHYRRYFKDRQRIVALSEQYEQAFIERHNIIREYDAELAELRDEIDDLSVKLHADDDELQKMRNQMNQYRAENNVSQYNSLVAVYNGKVNTFNREADNLSALIARYNSVVQQRNSVVSEEAELVKAIDSREVVPDQR